MPDEIIRELWRIKDAIGQEHGNNIRALASYLQGKSRDEPRVDTKGSRSQGEAKKLSEEESASDER